MRWALWVTLLLLGTAVGSPLDDPGQPQAARSAPTVTDGPQTLQGLWGRRAPTVAVFLGIPYAAPPVGRLRWQAPQAPARRTGRQPADQSAPACYQAHDNAAWYDDVARAFGRDRSGIEEPRFSEDCLYLNIWTPTPNTTAHLPVLVWIHGGANKAGWALEPNYDGERLAAEGQIVVSIAYRLGVFGFFSHPELPHDRPRSNFGLLDQIAALHWIHDHIGVFGGDPTRVTIAGESAGAADIAFLLASPLADSLFARAISESGGYLLADRRTERDEEALGRQLAQALPRHATLRSLRRLDSRTLFETAGRALDKHEYGPVLDGYAVTERPASVFARRGIRHDLLIGSNQNEWYMYVDAKPSTLVATLATVSEPARKLIGDRVLKEPTQQHANDVAEALIEMHCPAYLMAAAAERAGRRSFLYRFTRVRAGPGGERLLAYHGAEIPYAFDTHDEWLPMTPADRALSDSMRRYWSAFTRSGDPNAQDLAMWPSYHAKAPVVQELGEHIGSIAAPDHALCDQLEPMLYHTDP